jgi:colicin import membrane protein
MNFAYVKQNVLPLLISVGLHSFLIAMIFSGWTMEPPKREIQRPSYVQATLVKLKDQAKSAKKPDSNTPKVVDVAKQKKEAEQQKKLAEQKRQQEIKRQQETEQKKKIVAERVKQDLAKKAKEKVELERKAREQAERKKQEQQKQEAIKRQQEKAALDQKLAQENMQQLEASYAAAAQSYMSAISQKVEQNWSRPPSARNDMQCELLIKLVPTGRVINVDIVKSSGDPSFDRSAVQAVQKAEQFPVIKEMKPEVFERYYRELNLIFKPQDLRQ